MGSRTRKIVFRNQTREDSMKGIEISQYNHLVDSYNSLLEVHRNDCKWHELCMSFVGNREKIETKAQKMVEKHGIIKALRMQRRKK